MSTHTAALLATLATMAQGYRLDVSCSPIDYARSLNRKYWDDKADEAAKMKRLIYDGEIIYLDEYCNEQDWRIMHKVWEDEETKCRAKAEQYK